MIMDKINKEKEKRKIDMYVANLDLFFAAMSDINDLTSIVLENCLNVKYLTLFRDELEDCASQKRNFRNQLNDLKTLFFLILKNLKIIS